MINARMFNLSAGLGLLVAAVLGAMMLTAGAAFPFYVGNVGNFLISGDKLTVDGFVLQLDVDGNSGSDGGALPAGVNRLESAKVKNMVIEKAFNVSSMVGNTSNPMWKLRMTSAAPVKINGALIRMSGLCADKFKATDFEADAMGANTADFTDDFALRAGSVSITNFGLDATYLATSGLTVKGLDLKIIPGDYDKPSCLP